MVPPTKQEEKAEHNTARPCADNAGFLTGSLPSTSTSASASASASAPAPEPAHTDVGIGVDVAAGAGVGLLLNSAGGVARDAGTLYAGCFGDKLA
jgi:hypothetical protein